MTAVLLPVVPVVPPEGAPAAPLAPGGLPGAAPGARRALVMGVVNATPDSFSDGGRWASVEAAAARGLALRVAGADLVDVGGESTRPGAGRVPVAEELDRVLPVVTALVAAGAVVSVDTSRAVVAAAATAAGAAVVNDVSGGLADPEMPAVMAASGAVCVLSHWRGPSATMAQRTDYGPRGVVAQVRDHLRGRVAALVAAGVDPGRLVVDPGLGFAKDAAADWALLRALPELVADGVPVLVGASRKRFLGALLGEGDPHHRGRTDPDRRDDATAAVTALAAAAGVWAVRVHEVSASADAVRVAARWGAA